MRKRVCVAIVASVVVAAAGHAILDAQSVSINKNIMAGVQDQFIGDMYRQRQNENAVCVFSNNPLVQIHAFNDYRTVDEPLDSQVGTPEKIFKSSFAARLFDFLRGRSTKRPATLKASASAQAWIGLSFTDNDKDFYTGLLPGSPFSPDNMGNDAQGQPRDALKNYGFQAASDPVFAATPDKCLLAGIAFTPDGNSAGFVSRFTNKNNTETGRNTVFDFTRVLLVSSAKFFVDKPSIAAGPNGKVYAAFVLFDESDPAKLSSKIVMFQSSDYGATWPTPGITLSQPLTRNQAPWIVVDPNNENMVYVGWRVFSAQAGGYSNAVVGKRSSTGGLSFEPSVPYPVALLLNAYDQPRTEYPVPPIPRSNAYPTAVMDSHGAIHLAMQEYVNKTTGYPLLPGQATTNSLARITVSTSYNKGVTWSLRRAIDYGPGSGPQFMPALSVTGRPGPACTGKAGPRSVLNLIYYDARASYPYNPQSTYPNGNVFFGGGNAQFDVRVTQADPCTPDSGGRPVFGQSQQVSQYTRRAQATHAIVAIEGFDGSTPSRPYIPATNRPYRIFSGAKSAFTGDYLANVPKVGYVLTPGPNGTSVWKPTTAATVNRDTLPAPVFVTAWPDTRDVILPTVPSPASPLLLPANDPGYIDSLPFDNYAPPGLGLQPTSLQCWNPGSRDQNPYSAEVHGGLFAAAPVTFKQSNIPREYPVYVENRTGVGRFFRITIDASANAQFNVPGPNVTPAVKVADVAIAPFSTVTGTVIINAGVNLPVPVAIAEIDALAAASALPNGLKTTVTINTVNASAGTSETHQPAIDAIPTVTKPFGTIPAGGIQIGDQNPFVQNPFGQNPFGQNPFGQNPFGQNPFGQNPFGQNPFGQNPSVYDVTDVSFTVTNDGTHVSSYSAIAAVQQAVAACKASDKPCYMFQTIVNRISLVAGLNGCQTIETPVDNQVTQTPFVQNPFGQNPFGQNPFGQNPFGQNENPNDPNLPNPVTSPSVSNSTFYLAPAIQPDQNTMLEGTRGLPGTQMAVVRASDTTGELVPVMQPAVASGFRAARPEDEIVYTVRVFQMAQNPPVAFSATKVSLTVLAQVPDVINGVFDPGGPTGAVAGSGPTRVVVNTNDSGAGSLRAAILEANRVPGADTIVFNIPTGPYTIVPQTALPTITDPVTIDGTTQPGFTGSPIIELRGTPLGQPTLVGWNGLHITGGNSTVRGLAINRFGGEGVRVDTNGGNLIERNYIGTDVTGTQDRGNNASGVYLRRSGGNSVIGNVVSGNNGFAGIAICGNPSFCGGGEEIGENGDADGNIVQSNLVGTNAAGTAAIGNGTVSEISSTGYGVSIDGASNTVVGGTTAATRNVIANNVLDGVVVFNAPASGNAIRGNSIFANGGLGIDLVDVDGDPSPNNRQNSPELGSLTSEGGSTVVRGTLSSNADATFTIDFYSNAACDPTGSGEGATFMGSRTVTTNGRGNANIDTTFAVALTANEQVTATATDSAGNTSEFSNCAPLSTGVITFQDQTVGSYATGTVTLSAGGIPVTFSGTGLQVRDITSFGFPAGASRALSTNIGPYEPITATITFPVGVTANFVQIRNWISGVYTAETDTIVMSAYNASGGLLGTVTSSAEFVSLAFAGIAKVVFDDVATGYLIDEFQFIVESGGGAGPLALHDQLPYWATTSAGSTGLAESGRPLIVLPLKN